VAPSTREGEVIMEYKFWSEFAVLMIGAFIGAAALIPYSMKLISASAKKKPLKMSPRTLALLSFVQNAALGGITIGVGLFVAHKISLGAPTIGALVNGHGLPYSWSQVLFYPVLAGLVIGALMTMIDLAYLPHWPKSLLEAAKNTSLRENFLACFYGGLNEEYLTRLFGVSLVAWLLTHIGHHSGNVPSDWVMWTAILIMALLFAIGHLPALKGVGGKVSGVMLSRTFVLNMPIAIACGWFYWKYGIEAAIIAHFAADLIYHVGGTVVLNSKVSTAGAN